MAEDKDRREFIKAIAAGSAVALRSWPALAVQTSPQSHFSIYKALTNTQAALIDAIAEQIIPADEYPGAIQVGVTRYIDGILAGPFGEFYRARYEDGLQAVDRLSREHYRLNFVDVNSDRKDSVLKMLESAKDSTKIDREFFEMMLQHTFEGYYGDPEHGGNLEEASWKMIGFAG